MTGEQRYNVATIRELLLESFSAGELRRFCQDHPVFQPVVRSFGPGHGLDDMVDRVLEHCRTRLLWKDLLAQVKGLRPRQYARFEPELFISDIEQPRDGEPPGLTPEILTITSPIYLDLVKVPAGEFLMGSVAARDKHAQDNELPPHRVHVPGFRIGKYPVTNLQYATFAKATRRYSKPWLGDGPPVGKENHPIAPVRLEDAHAFCAWLSAETGLLFRLPTEAEWEKAARGTDGRIYPWGHQPPDESRCNLSNSVADTTPIGRYSPLGDSPYGCADMVGNAMEWCQSLYKPYPYRAGDGREDLLAGGRRVLRGGLYISDERNVRCANRGFDAPGYLYRRPGFRVVVAPNPSDL